jgi:hypothetical protein
MLTVHNPCVAVVDDQVSFTSELELVHTLLFTLAQDLAIAVLASGRSNWLDSTSSHRPLAQGRLSKL